MKTENHILNLQSWRYYNVSTLIKLNITRLMLSSTLAEESGELVKAVLDHEEKNSSQYAIVTEAIQTAATAIRFLKNYNMEKK